LDGKPPLLRKTDAKVMAQVAKYIIVPLLLVLVIFISLRQDQGKLIEFVESHHQRRSLGSTSSTTSSSSCEISKPADLHVPSTFVASYPGSGAKLTWKLIRGITGLYTGDDFDHNGRVARGTAVAIKTHFPSHAPEDVFHSGKLDGVRQAILLIRNPLRAIPSFHNYLYEKKQGLLNHSTRAPVEVWVEWRNQFFQEEMTLWVDHIRWWMENFNKSGNTLKLLVFEYLTSQTEGTKELTGLFDFFASTDPVIRNNMVPHHHINCIWEMLVKGTVPGEKERRKSLRTGPSEYPYTSSQLEIMIQSIQRLRTEYQASYPPLGDAMDFYLAEIEQLKARIQSDATI
jgi:hypothetical protein